MNCLETGCIDLPQISISTCTCMVIFSLIPIQSKYCYGYNTTRYAIMCFYMFILYLLTWWNRQVAKGINIDMCYLSTLYQTFKTFWWLIWLYIKKMKFWAWKLKKKIYLIKQAGLVLIKIVLYLFLDAFLQIFSEKFFENKLYRYIYIF